MPLTHSVQCFYHFFISGGNVSICVSVSLIQLTGDAALMHFGTEIQHQILESKDDG